MYAISSTQLRLSLVGVHPILDSCTEVAKLAQKQRQSFSIWLERCIIGDFGFNLLLQADVLLYIFGVCFVS